MLSPGYFLLTCHDSLHPYCLFELHYETSSNRLHYSSSPTLFSKLCVLEVTMAVPCHEEHCSTSTAIWCHILKEGLLGNKNACKQKKQTLMWDKFEGHVTMHHDKFLTIKPTRCTNFSNLFLEWNSTRFGQFLCPSSGVFHCTTYTIAMCTVKNSWWWTEELSKTCSFIPKISLRN